MAGMRQCPICGKDFYDNSRSNTKRTCSNKCRDALNYRDPDKKFARAIEMRLNVLKRQGVEFDEQTIEQIKQDVRIGKCHICKQPVDQRQAHIDHDHITGKYRGVLCPQHNYALGNIHDSPLEAIALCEYLIANKARGIDWTDSEFLSSTIANQAYRVIEMVEAK